MRVAVIGAGAIGCAFGCALTEAGHTVRLVDIWTEHITEITAHGLSVSQFEGERSVALAISADPAVAADAEVVLIAVKAHANNAVARALAPVLSPEAIVVTVQNGIGNDAQLAAILPARQVVQGSTTVGGQMLAAGRLAIVAGTAQGRSRTVLGRPGDRQVTALALRFADALADAGLPAEVIDDVRDVVWRKALLAAPMGPLCATIGCTVADVLERPTAIAVLRRAFAEIVAVAAAEGVDFALEQVWDESQAVYRSVGPHPPSLALDVARGRPTEVEAQIGQICRRGAAAQIATPVCDTLATLMRAREP